MHKPRHKLKVFRLNFIICRHTTETVYHALANNTQWIDLHETV